MADEFMKGFACLMVGGLSGDRFRSEIPELVMQAANIIEVNLETTTFDPSR